MAGDKSKFAITLDEVLIYEYGTNGKTRICYVLCGKTKSDDQAFEEAESFSKSFMVVGFISGSGKVPLLPVKRQFNHSKSQNKFRVLFKLRFKATLLIPSSSFVSERNGKSVSALR